MAVACAAAFGADQLIFLTDVAGVLDAREAAGAAADRGAQRGDDRARAWPRAACRRSSKRRTAHCAEGWRQVRICAGAAEGILERILAGEEVGTRLAKRRYGAMISGLTEDAIIELRGQRGKSSWCAKPACTISGPYWS